jgi:hypothetical protein
MVIRGKTLISAQSKLSKIVQKELKHEEENYEIEPESTVNQLILGGFRGQRFYFARQKH